MDPLNRGAGRPSKAALSAYQLHDEMRDSYGRFTSPLALERWWGKQPRIAELATSAGSGATSSAAAASGAATGAAVAPDFVAAPASGSRGMEVSAAQEQQQHHYRNDDVKLLSRTHLGCGRGPHGLVHC